MTTIVYSDLSTNFDVHPIKQDLMLLTNEAAVKRSVRNLILTNPNERFFNLEVGSGIIDTLFENLSRDNEFILKQKIVDVIRNYEPRASLISVNVKSLPDDNAYSVNIVFAIVNKTTPTSLDLILRRVR
jgi:phage baseplate assembly protein W